MPKIKKTPHQFLRNVVTGSLVAVVAVAILGGLLQNIFIFMLTGIIEGTGIIVPVWGMFTLYASIITLFIGDRLVAYFMTPAEKPKTRRHATARRRYVH